jgi:hypothetical protein
MATKSPPTQLSPKAALRLYLHMIGGTKGGIGKSTFCRVLYQYCLDKTIPVAGFEGDTRTPDFAGFYKEIEESDNIVRFSEDEAQVLEPNALVNKILEDKVNVVVNLPASVDIALKLWLDSSHILSIAKDQNIQLVKWFIVTGEYDSTQSLRTSLNTFGQTIPHVVVKNQKYSDWSFFDQDKEIQALIAACNCKTITFPKLNVRLAGTILQNRLTYQAATQFKAKGFGLIEQQAIQGFLNEAYAAIESTGYAPVPATPVAP